jgi:hypothetical protein
LADDLAAAELHDVDDVERVGAVIPDGELVDPEVLAAGGPMQFDADPGGVGRPEGNDVGLAADALLALG